MILEEISRYSLLLTDLISLVDCLYVLRYWTNVYCNYILKLALAFLSNCFSALPKHLLSWERKELLRKNKKPFSSFLKGSHWNKSDQFFGKQEADFDSSNTFCVEMNYCAILLVTLLTTVTLMQVIDFIWNEKMVKASFKWNIFIEFFCRMISLSVVCCVLKLRLWLIFVQKLYSIVFKLFQKNEN